MTYKDINKQRASTRKSYHKHINRRRNDNIKYHYKKLGYTEEQIIQKQQEVIIKRERRNRTYANLSEADKIWLACAIDGKGCVCLYNERKWPIVEVDVCNSDIRFVKNAARIMDSTIQSCSGVNPSHLGKKIMYKTALRGHTRVKNILLEISPYLIIKQEKAKNIIDFIDSREWGRKPYA